MRVEVVRATLDGTEAEVIVEPGDRVALVHPDGALASPVVVWPQAGGVELHADGPGFLTWAVLDERDAVRFAAEQVRDTMRAGTVYRLEPGFLTWAVLDERDAVRFAAAVPDGEPAPTPRPTREQVDAALAFADRNWVDDSHTCVLAAKVRALRAELDHHQRGHMDALVRREEAEIDRDTARDHADAELRHRDDLARDAARLWRTEDTRPGGPSDALSAALDRLAAAYSVDVGEEP